MLDRNDPKFRELVEKGIPIERLEKRLRPILGLGDWNQEVEAHDGFGDFSHEGFLGIDESLSDVVYADCEVVESHGTTHQEIAEALSKAIKNGMVPNPEYGIYDKFPDRGAQHCPWECKDRYEIGGGSIIIYIPQEISQNDLIVIIAAVEGVDRESGVLADLPSTARSHRDLNDRAAVVTELHPHLIDTHYFFEGKQSLYRADPRVLIPALNLAWHPMIYAACFWTEEANFDKVKSLVVQELGCVEDIAEVRRPNSFVWVDDEGIGRYHVQFCASHRHGSHIKIHYMRPTPEIEAIDPMKEALFQTYEILKPVRVTDFAMQELNLEGLLSP